MKKPTWNFTCIDNGSKRQCLTVSASSKPEAITKGLEKAKKKAYGEITSWNCYLVRA